LDSKIGISTSIKYFLFLSIIINSFIILLKFNEKECEKYSTSTLSYRYVVKGKGVLEIIFIGFFC